MPLTPMHLSWQASLHRPQEYVLLLKMTTILSHACAGTQCEALVARLNAAVADLNLYDILDPCYTGHHATNVKSSQQRPLRKGGTPAGLWPAPN